MKRIRYITHVVAEDAPTALVSSQAFTTTKGEALVFLFNTTFEIREAVTGELLASGESKKGNAVYLKKIAKNALVALMGVNPFESETRKKKEVV